MVPMYAGPRSLSTQCVQVRRSTTWQWRMLTFIGLVKSDLGRAYKTSALLSFAVDMFMTLAAKTTEGGARSLVLSAMTTPEENGKYFTNYQSDEDYKK